MKKLITFLLFALPMIGISQLSQSPWQKLNSNIESVSHQPTALFDGGFSNPASAYYGANLLYQFSDDTTLQDHMLLSPSFMLPLARVGNVDIAILTDIDLSAIEFIEDFHIGLYPYSVVSEGNNSKVIANGGIQFNSDGKLENKRFTMYAGFEYALYSRAGLPLSLSAAPFFTFFDEENIIGLDATLILPLASGLAFMTNIKKEFDDTPMLFNMGFIANKLL